MNLMASMCCLRIWNRSANQHLFCIRTGQTCGDEIQKTVCLTTRRLSTRTTLSTYQTNRRSPRLSELIHRFSEEMDELDAKGHGDIREHKIGCVLFTERNGTIDGDGLMVDIKHLAETHHHGKHFRIFTLRGGQGVRDMKATMQQCHRLSLIKGFSYLDYIDTCW